MGFSLQPFGLSQQASDFGNIAGLDCGHELDSWFGDVGFRNVRQQRLSASFDVTTAQNLSVFHEPILGERCNEPADMYAELRTALAREWALALTPALG